MSSNIFLVDTHVLLWMLWDDPSLSQAAREILEADMADVRISAASIWEIGIKLSNSKFPQKFVIEDIFELCDDLRISVETISRETLIAVAKLPYPTLHKDPFDRLIACTCLANGFTLIGADTAFDQYGVSRIW